MRKAGATCRESPSMEVNGEVEDDTKAHLLRVGHIHSAKLFAHSTHLFWAQRPLDAFVTLHAARDLCRIEYQSPGDGMDGTRHGGRCCQAGCHIPGTRYYIHKKNAPSFENRNHYSCVRRTRKGQSQTPRRLRLLQISLPLRQRCSLHFTLFSGLEKALGIFSPSVLVLGQDVRYSVQRVAYLYDSVRDHFCQPRKRKRAAERSRVGRQSMSEQSGPLAYSVPR